MPMRKAVSVFAGLPGSHTPVVTALTEEYLMVIGKLPFRCRESLRRTNHSIKPCTYGGIMGQGFGDQAAGFSAFSAAKSCFSPPLDPCCLRHTAGN